MGPNPSPYYTIGIEWFRILNSNTTLENLNELADRNPKLFDVTVMMSQTSPPPDSIIVESELTMKNVIPNDVQGIYWCVVVIHYDPPRANRQYFTSDKSDITAIEGPGVYVTADPCLGGSSLASLRSSCVTFDPLPAFLQNNGSSSASSPSDAQITSNSSSSTSPPSVTIGDPSLVPSAVIGGTILNTTMIIILSAIGATLCIVIHVLLAIVSCLCIKNRKKNRVQRGKSSISTYLSLLNLRGD